ncbi:MAG: hypothetical protein IPO02_09800 [Bacteroidetes bacterium]|nr:hypothetical protein [Bacteroidota bacterium]
MHFAKEVFSQIEDSCKSAPCSVLMFDIKSFFSRIDHGLLEKAWLDIIGKEEMPKDHKNVFNAATRFSYILLDDLRVSHHASGRRAGFDEQKLYEVRKIGKFSYFSSLKEFRDKIKNKELKLYRFPFWDKSRNVPVGIPQGLPISTILANLYLLDFDIKVVSKVVTELKGFYRRYSDDIIITCDPKDVDDIKEFIYKEIKSSLVVISEEKTEEYLFKNYQVSKKVNRLTSMKIVHSRSKVNELDAASYSYCKIGAPLTYLGFEYYGYQTLIKSANLSKFYRRMIHSVKTRATRAKKIKVKNPAKPLAVFANQLYKIYTLRDLSKTKISIRTKKLEQQDVGTYVLKVDPFEIELRSNYLSYVRNVSVIMVESKIKNQIRKHQEIFRQAIKKHLANFIP